MINMQKGSYMETTEKNRFSILLDQLINTGEVKNASLAAALRYDASYISKWITVRMIPAEKTKRKSTQRHQPGNCQTKYAERIGEFVCGLSDIRLRRTQNG